MPGWLIVLLWVLGGSAALFILAYVVLMLIFAWGFFSFLNTWGVGVRFGRRKK